MYKGLIVEASSPVFVSLRIDEMLKLLVVSKGVSQKELILEQEVLQI